MSQPFLTIGIASYNYLQYLDKAYEQIKKQSFMDIEVLYCDDGSTDGSVEKIKQLIQTEKEFPVRLVEGNHTGILANRNRILEHARGKYVMICDADDYMSDNCLERLCSIAQQTEADCVIGGFCEVTDEGKTLKQHIPTADSSKWLYTWHHGQIYKLQIVREHNIWFEQIPDDVFYLHKIHKYSKNTVFVPECVYCWCRHSNSTSGDYSTNTQWHPVNLWGSIAPFTSALRADVNEAERHNISYYLYKWYYFNLTDLWREDREQRKKDIRRMADIMKTVYPPYLKFVSIKDALKTHDTGFARCAVLFCFLLEKLHLTQVVVLARKLQNELRE